MSDKKKPEVLDTIAAPPSTFVFGDGRYRALYGPPTPNGGRKLVGVLAEDQVSRLEAMLEYADENMPKGDA